MRFRDRINRTLIRGAFLYLALMVLMPLSLNAQSDADYIRRWKGEWPRTNFSKSSINLWEITSGGPPKDGIPPIDKPKFVTADRAAKWLGPGEPVMMFRHNGDVRAYPLQILIWHEIVNDTVGGLPVTATFCPLCNSVLVFDRRVGDRVLDFGTTGKLRKSDLVMWDRQTESWWQQLTGEAIIGEMTGTQLTFLPAPLISFATYQQAFPQGKVLSRETGHVRDYGSNPYMGYDNMANNQPFLFKQKVDHRLRAMERVVVLEVGKAAKAFPYSELAKVGVVNDTVGGTPIVVAFAKGTRSALDRSSIRDSREVGSGVIFRRELSGAADVGRTLTFARVDEGDRDRKDQDGGVGVMRDKETGSTWNVLGEAVSGSLKGQHLNPIAHGNHFAFAWLAFRPQSAIYRAP